MKLDSYDGPKMCYDGWIVVYMYMFVSAYLQMFICVNTANLHPNSRHRKEYVVPGGALTSLKYTCRA